MMTQWVWCVCLATVAQAQIGYLSYGTGIAPSGVAAADFNGDGKLDFVVASSDANPLIIFLNDGKGGFRAQQVPFSLGPLAPHLILTSDLNGDHKTDLVVFTGSVGVAVLLGNGDGTFQAPLPVPGCPLVAAAQIADLDGDGIPDLALTCLNGGFLVPTGAYLSIQPGKGDGTFGTGTSYSLGFTPWAVFTIGDFNRDGKPDVAVASEGNVTVLLNDGKANFKLITSHNEPWDFAPGIAAGDFNGDGMLDLAVTAQSLVGGARGTVTILLGNGDGTFRAAPGLETNGFGQIVAMDLNGDGHIDLAESLGTLVYFAGRGDGTFETGFPFRGSGNTGNFTLADFTGSGVMGFAGTNDFHIPDLAQTSGSVVILPHAAWPSLTLTNTSAAGYGLGPLAPGSIVTAFGGNLATQTAQATGTLPVLLGGAAVTVTDSTGSARLAQLYYVSPGQVNYVIPAATAPGSATVSITADGHVTATDKIDVAAVAPALFTVNPDNLAAANVLRISQNGDRTFESIYQTDQNGNITALPIDLGSETDAVYLILYGTGIRNRQIPGTMTTSIGGLVNTGFIMYAGAQGTYEGLDQVNILLPRSLASPVARTNGLQLVVDGQPSNQVTLLIQ